MESTPYATDDGSTYRTKYRVVEVHRHCALATAEAMEALIELDNETGVVCGIMLDGDSPEGSLPAWLELKRKYPDRISVFWKLSFAKVAYDSFFDDILDELERAAALGVQGVKVWKDLGMFVRDGKGELLAADDPRLDPFWDRCGALGLPVLWHVADPKEYWSPLGYHSFHYGFRAESAMYYSIPGMPPWEELIRQRDAVLARHPGTTFIGAHMGSQTFELDRLAEALDRYPNFFVDTAARLRIFGRLNPPAVHDFFVRYQDRIVFGTDHIPFQRKRPGPASPVARRAIDIYPSDNPSARWIDPGDPADSGALRQWRESAAFEYGQYFKYFETDQVGIIHPGALSQTWLRLAGVKLPEDVLEKLYHANAERLIPGLVRSTKGATVATRRPKLE